MDAYERAKDRDKRYLDAVAAGEFGASSEEAAWWIQEQGVLDSLPEPAEDTGELTYLGAPPTKNAPSPPIATNDLIRQRILEHPSEHPSIDDSEIVPQQGGLLKEVPEPRQPEEPPSRRVHGSNAPFLQQAAMMPPAAGGGGNEASTSVLHEIAEASKEQNETMKAAHETLQAMEDKLDDVGKLGP